MNFYTIGGQKSAAFPGQNLWVVNPPSYLLPDAFHDVAALLLDRAADLGGLRPQPHAAVGAEVNPLLKRTVSVISRNLSPAFHHNPATHRV